MHTARIGIAHPGAMGAAVGAALRETGVPVAWASKGRSASTLHRAGEAGMTDVGDLATLAAGVDVLLSICPPHAALRLAEDVAAVGYSGIYVDANAISPAAATEVAHTVGTAGAEPVDGGIVGPPPRTAGSTRLYLSGDAAGEVAAAFRSSRLEAVWLHGPVGQASALKSAFALWTKGTAALLGTIRAFARHHGVDEALLAEWEISLPHLVEHSSTAPRRAAAKAWRFAGELEEIARAFRDAGLPDGAAAGAARTYERLATFKDAADAPPLAALLDALTEAAPSVRST